MRRRLRLVAPLALIFAGFLLASCAETELFSHAAKQLERDSPPIENYNRGEPLPVGYKLGRPYKVNGVWYYPSFDSRYDETGIASWYGSDFHGRRTASGEPYNMHAVTAAHQTMPLPSIARVTNLENGRSMLVRVNDRGPFVNGRIIDMSKRGAQLLGFYGKGTAKVRVQFVGFARQDQIASTEPVGIRTRQVASAPKSTMPEVRVAAEPTRQLARVTNATTERQIAAAEPAPAAPRSAIVVESLDRPEIKQPINPAPSLAGKPVEQSSGGFLAAEAAELPADFVLPKREPDMFIQVASFGNANNAKRLGRRLHRLGPTVIAPAMLDGRQFFRVRVGPIATVDEADQLLARLIRAGFPGARIIIAQ